MKTRRLIKKLNNSNCRVLNVENRFNKEFITVSFNNRFIAFSNNHYNLKQAKDKIKENINKIYSCSASQHALQDGGDKI